jgi:hypothetical protein
MGLNTLIKQNQKTLAVTGFTGAAPQAVNGTSISMVAERVAIGSMSANVYALATTDTLTATAKWQVSTDATTWRDAKGPNNPANVAIVTGTGSAVTDTVCIAAPDCVYGKPYARCIVVSGVGVGAGAGVDEASVSYNWRLADS